MAGYYACGAFIKLAFAVAATTRKCRRGCFKVIMATDNKYIKLVYNIMIYDLERRPNTTNWASLIRHLLLALGFQEVWF